MGMFKSAGAPTAAGSSDGASGNGVAQRQLTPDKKRTGSRMFGASPRSIFPASKKFSDPAVPSAAPGDAPASVARRPPPPVASPAAASRPPINLNGRNSQASPRAIPGSERRSLSGAAPVAAGALSASKSEGALPWEAIGSSLKALGDAVQEALKGLTQGSGGSESKSSMAAELHDIFTQAELPITELAAGEVLIREGEASTAMYLLVKGSLVLRWVGACMHAGALVVPEAVSRTHCMSALAHLRVGQQECRSSELRPSTPPPPFRIRPKPFRAPNLHPRPPAAPLARTRTVVR